MHSWHVLSVRLRNRSFCFPSSIYLCFHQHRYSNRDWSATISPILCSSFNAARILPKSPVWGINLELYDNSGTEWICLASVSAWEAFEYLKETQIRSYFINVFVRTIGSTKHSCDSVTNFGLAACQFGSRVSLNVFIFLSSYFNLRSGKQNNWSTFRTDIPRASDYGDGFRRHLKGEAGFSIIKGNMLEATIPHVIAQYHGCFEMSEICYFADKNRYAIKW